MSDFGKDINVPSKDIVYRQDVEDMLQNALPSRGMWEIEGDVVKNTICETVADLMVDLEELPSAEPEIIRCKDCKFYIPMNRKTKTGICNLTMHQNFGHDWFCAGAKKRVDMRGDSE